jgi:hypothetical protein
VTSLIGKIGGSSTKAGCSGDQISQAADYYQAGSRASKLVENSLKKFNFKSKTDENRSPQFVSPSRKRLREEDDLDSSKMSSEASTSSSSKVSRNNVAVHDLNIKPAAAVSSAKLKSSKVQKAKNQQRQSAAENKTSAAELPVVIKSKSDFLKFSPAELRKAGILVQNRSYKKVRELPLANGDDIKVKPGEKVTFFKNGQTQICMSYNGKMFVPLVDDEHIRGIFKDYTDEEFSNSDSKAVQKIVMKVKVKEKQSKPNNDDQIIAKTTAADMTVVVQSCPICGKQFNNEAKLISHAANCNGEVENDDKCPICSCIFRIPSPSDVPLLKCPSMVTESASPVTQAWVLCACLQGCPRLLPCTDPDLTNQVVGPCVELKVPDALLDNMDEWCTKHHAESGLTDKCRKTTLT